LRALPEIKQGCRLRQVIERERCRTRHHFLRQWCQPVLQHLGFHGPHDIQTHRRRQHPAQVIEEEQADDSVAGSAQLPQAGAEDGGEVRERSADSLVRELVGRRMNWRTRLSAFQENAFHRREKCPPLQPARTVRHMIREERLTKPIQFSEALRLIESSVHERQRRAPQLAQARFKKGQQLIAIANFPMLPRRLKPGRVREAARGKGGVNELPKEEISAAGRCLESRL